jgi:FixJ family two-component response regulator
MYEKGALRYIRKPGDFSLLKKVIANALETIIDKNFKQPTKEDFILQP